MLTFYNMLNKKLILERDVCVCVCVCVLFEETLSFFPTYIIL